MIFDEKWDVLYEKNDVFRLLTFWKDCDWCQGKDSEDGKIVEIREKC
jgi:hypothetical protein